MPVCKGCQAKDAEIQRLTDQVGRLLEVVAPVQRAVEMSKLNGRFDDAIEDALAVAMAGMPQDVVRTTRKTVAKMVKQKAPVDDVVLMIQRGETVPPTLAIEAF